jgi:hypothetical protein
MSCIEFEGKEGIGILSLLRSREFHMSIFENLAFSPPRLYSR